MCELTKTIRFERFCDRLLLHLRQLYDYTIILVCRKYTDIFTTVVGTPSFVNTILHHTQCRTTVLQPISVVESQQSRPCCFGPVHTGDKVDRIGNKVKRIGNNVERIGNKVERIGNNVQRSC